MGKNLKYKVKYISNSSTETDELFNKPHESVAESLYDLLENHSEIAHPVIGIEGSWGSGKSQVIHILQRLIRERGKDSKYVFLTYDIWSTQEDLTRRSFLDSVLSKVKNDNTHFTIQQLEEDYTQLNATKTKHSVKSFPLVRLFFASILLIPILLFVINAVESLFGYNQSAIWTYDQLKGFCSLICAVFSLVLFLIAYVEERGTVKTDIETKDKAGWDRFQIIIGRLFYLFKAKDVEKTEYETIYTDEPSISRFQNFFDHVRNSLTGDSTLVIVFDNMDRLSDPQRLMSTWSLLHTFFAEKKYDGKVWALVPYAKNQLSELMAGIDKEDSNEDEGENVKKKDKTTEFINKTFFTSFRIPEPIMGSWKIFLENKLNEAFDPALSDDEKNMVTLVFSRSMVGNTICPRDIITFVNRLVSIYSQHYFEDVPMQYVALYAQFEGKFANNPADAILSYRGFEHLTALVGKEELSRWLSSIYYNLPSSKALEVVYDREIQSFLQGKYEVTGEKDELLLAYSTLSNNQHFQHHIGDFFLDGVNLSEYRLENVFYLLKQTNILEATRRNIINLVHEQIALLDDQLQRYESWMESVFLEYDYEIINELINRILANARGSFELYYTSAIPLLKLKRLRNDLRVNVSKYKSELPKEMLSYCQYLKEKDAVDLYGKANISIDATKVLEYMKEGTAGNILFGNNADSTYDLLRLMKQNSDDLKPIQAVIMNTGINLVTLNHKQIEQIYKVHDIVADNKKVVPPYTLYDANATKFLDIPEYFACALMQLKNRGKVEINNCISGDVVKDDLSTSQILSSYFSYNDILKLTTTSLNLSLKKICMCMANNNIGKLSSAEEVFSQTNVIIDSIFTENPEPFLSYLDLNVESIKNLWDKKPYLSLNDYWKDNISKENISNHVIYEEIKNKWISEINELNDEAWNNILSGSNVALSGIILKLKELDFLPTEIWAKIPIEEVTKVFVAYIVEKKDIDDGLFAIWKQTAKKAVLAKIANNTMDSIDNPKQIGDIRFVAFVDMLLSNSERIKDENRVDAIYDEYVADYLSKDCHEHIVQFICDNYSNFSAFALKLDQERKELICAKFDNLLAHIDSGSSSFKKISALKESIKPQKADVEDDSGNN